MQTRSRCGVTTEENAKSCWSVKNRLMQQTDPFIWPVNVATAAILCGVFFLVFYFNSEQEKARYQSATGTISLSDWFPTTWSMKSRFPFGLEERRELQIICWPRGMITFISTLQNNSSKLTVYLKRSPSIEEDEIPAGMIHCTLPSPQTCAWCHRTAQNKIIEGLTTRTFCFCSNDPNGFSPFEAQQAWLCPTCPQGCRAPWRPVRLAPWLSEGTVGGVGKVNWFKTAEFAKDTCVWTTTEKQTCTRESQSCTVNATSFTPSPCFTKCSPISESRGSITLFLVRFPE